MNCVTPRVFIAATRQNDGKTTTSLGLLAAIQHHHPRVGYIKPVGQRFVEVREHKIDEDTVLMDSVYQLNTPLVDMSPIAIEPDFTRKYLTAANRDVLVGKIQTAFDRVAWERDFVLCEGSGHAGVGSVFDLSNAQVANILGAKVVIVTRGGIGKPIDEVALNQALFEREGVEVIGVIVNKVIPDKVDYVADFVRRGLKRRGLDLLGVLPYHPILMRPTVVSIEHALDADPLNDRRDAQLLVEHVVIGAMSVQNARQHFRQGVLFIVPGDREDMLLAAAAELASDSGRRMAGIILTGGLKPSADVLRLLRDIPCPVLLAGGDSYDVASTVHDIIVKTRPDDVEKIALIRDMIARSVDVKRILSRL